MKFVKHFILMVCLGGSFVGFSQTEIPFEKSLKEASIKHVTTYLHAYFYNLMLQSSLLDNLEPVKKENLEKLRVEVSLIRFNLFLSQHSNNRNMLNSMPKPVLEFPVEELSKWEHYNKPQEREALDSLRVKVGFIRAILKEIPAMQIFLKQEKQMVDALEQMYDSTPWQKQQVTQEILNSLDVYSDLKAQVGDFFKTIKVEENRRFFESVYKAKRLESLMHKMMGLSLIVSTGSTVSAWFGAAGIVGFVAVTALDYFKQIQLRRQIRSDIVLPTGILSYSSGQLLNLFINDFEKLRQDYAKLPLPREKNGVKSPFCAVVGGIGKYLFPKMLRQSLTAEVLDANLNNRCEVNAFMESARELALPAPNCL